MNETNPNNSVYKDIIFRSKAEAKWAIFLNYLNIGFEYEFKKIRGNNFLYIPDFWLPQQKIWIEVKNGDVTEEEKIKAVELSKQEENPVFIFNRFPIIQRFSDPFDGESTINELSDFQIFWANSRICKEFFIGKPLNLKLISVLRMHSGKINKMEYKTISCKFVRAVNQADDYYKKLRKVGEYCIEYLFSESEDFIENRHL